MNVPSPFAQTVRYAAFLTVLVLPSVGLVVNARGTEPAAATSDWTVPDIAGLPNNAWGKLVREGRELTVATYAHLGPNITDADHRFSGNNMSCQNCHLEAGTKKFGLPFVGVFADFPQYRAREGEVGTLEDRINGCLTRSMNGRALPFESHEMKAFVAYIKFLSDGRPIGSMTIGRGTGKLGDMADHLAGPGAAVCLGIVDITGQRVDELAGEVGAIRRCQRGALFAFEVILQNQFVVVLGQNKVDAGPFEVALEQ